MARKRSAPRPPDTTLMLLVRHGQTPTTGSTLPGRAAGLNLADTGVAQAARAADRLAPLGDKVAAVYCSPLERTRQTAAPIARALGQRAKVDRGLLECDFGDWTGAELKDLFKLPEWRQVQTNPSGFRFPGGESFPEMQQRMCSAVARLAERHKGKAVVAVSHADPIKAVVAQSMGTHLDLFQRIVISPCSVSAIALGSGAPVVLCVNSTGDGLEKLVPS
jgi:probable phosphomutase (TIGR03848 family)